MNKGRNIATGQIYHVFTKSIANFKVFNSEENYCRIMDAIKYYQVEQMPFRFSRFLELKNYEKNSFEKHFASFVDGKEKGFQIVAYCIMPTHLHLVLKQLKENAVSAFMRKTLDSYTRYFNVKYKRKGPLWEGKFKSILVETDEYLLHLSRYIHLNPVTSYLVDAPEDWKYSSYLEYISKSENAESLCEYDGLFDITPSMYQNFVEDRIGYQRELAKIKHLLLE